MPAAVALRGITKRFPAVVANDQVDFEAAEGEVHALLGENGAGKTTLSNILTGLYRPDEGEILLSGRPVDFHSPRDAIAAGIAMVHQHFRLVSPFTVAENVVLGDQRDVGSLVSRAHRARSKLESRSFRRRYGLAVDPRARIWQLSVGEQQRVEVLKALYQDARILILDEPTAVLTPQEADALFETVRAMAADGRTVIFISHKLHEVKAVADRVTVLRRGRSLATVRCVGGDATVAGRVDGRSRGRDRAASRRSARRGRGRARARRRLGRRRPRSSGRQRRLARGPRAARSSRSRAWRETVSVSSPRRSSACGRRRRGRSRSAGVVCEAAIHASAISAGVAYVPEDRLGTGVAPA